MKQIFAKHWEKVALVVSLLILLAYGVYAGTMAKQPPVINDTTRITKDLDGTLTSKERALDPKLNTPEQIVKSFGAAAEAAAGEEFVYYRKTDIDVKTKIIPTVVVKKEKKDVKIFKNPVLAAPAVEPGTIKLTWSDSPETQNVVMTGYIVLRKAPGGKFEKLTADPIKDKAYADTAVEAKKEYAYIVRAVTADNELDSEAKAVTTVGVIDLEMKGVAEIPLEEGQPPVPTAQVNVKKFVDGKWRTKLYLLRKGDKIGTGDLATRCEVLDLAKVSVQRIEKYTVNKYDDKGLKIGEEEKERTREAQVWELKYKDEDGKTQKLYPAMGPPAAVPPPAPAPGTTPPAPGPAAPPKAPAPGPAAPPKAPAKP